FWATRDPNGLINHPENFFPLKNDGFGSKTTQCNKFDLFLNIFTHTRLSVNPLESGEFSKFTVNPKMKVKL
ncbi:MAG: hypothetical protein AAGM46_28465, partial [Cyanobacteria bacterium J06582_2]